MRSRPLPLCCALLSLVAGGCSSAPLEPTDVDTGSIEEVDLVPPQADWGGRNVAVSVAALLGGWSYWYGERTLLIETVPSDASVALYYIRANFQKRYEVARSPVRVRLGQRVHMTAKDSVVVRVFMPGHLSGEEKFRASEAPDRLNVQLEPLPNKLVFFGLVALGERTTLLLRTSDEPVLSLGRSRSFPGFTLSMAQTADGLEQSPRLAGGLVESVEVAQVGEDLLVRVETGQEDVEARSKRSFDPIRETHSLVIDLMPKGSRARSASSIRALFEQLDYRPGRSCDQRFEAVLREGLDPLAVARAFRPSGGVADLYRSESMKQLGRLERGNLTTLSGEPLRIGSSLELALALQSPATVRGYFGLLGAFARSQPDPPTALRSLLAPESSPGDFRPLWDAAESARSACLD